jgi:carboxyl-terminal processing protease
MRMKHFALWGYILVLCACNVPPITPLVELTSTLVPTSTVTPSPIPLTEAQQYLSHALDIIQENALNSTKVDWDKVRATALMAAKDAKSPADTYKTIEYVLGELGDHHSFFMTPDAAADLNNSTTTDYMAPSGKLLEGRLGYVLLFGFRAQKEEEMNKYADQLQNIIIDLSKQDVCGWIVNLRYNTGGNMWPMIAGLGALIGEGKLGAFKNINDPSFDWYYRDGQSWMGDTPVAKVSHPEFILDPDENPVAVLIGSQTASSGEITAISFRGRPNTQFFGKPSRGLTTVNNGFLLGDGAEIVLTVGIDVDRNGQEYGGSIDPDVVTSKPEQDAASWLLAQPACAQ